MGHQVRIVGIFWRRDVWCQHSDCYKNEQKRKTDDGRRIFENSAQRKFQFPDTGMLFFVHTTLIS
jgi:hypothetical protein